VTEGYDHVMKDTVAWHLRSLKITEGQCWKQFVSVLSGTHIVDDMSLSYMHTVRLCNSVFCLRVGQ
jgi:hypothetical protein